MAKKSKKAPAKAKKAPVEKTKGSTKKAAKKAPVTKAKKTSVTKAPAKIAKKAVKKARTKATAAVETAKKVKGIPAGFTTLTPHIVVDNAAKAIEFYKAAFGAVEVCRMAMPDGRLMHAEVDIRGSRLMLADDFPEWHENIRSSATAIGNTPVYLHLYVSDVDEFFQRAVSAGCEIKMPPMDMFWGDRYGQVRDPFGHLWSIATNQKELTPDEMASAAEAAMSAACPSDTGESHAGGTSN